MAEKEVKLLLADLRPYFSFSKGIFFLFLCLINTIVIYMYGELVLTDDIYYQTYGEKMAMERIENFLEVQRRFNWVGYILLPFILLIKISFTAFCLNVGVLFANLKIGFGKLFRISLVAELIFVVGNLIKTLWLGFFSNAGNLTEIQYFYPLSLINLFSPESIKSWFIYPVITANLFELFYMLALGLGIHWTIKRPYGQTLTLVAASYGTGLLVWAVFVVFLSINLS